MNGGIQETVKGSSDNRVRLEGGAGRSVLKNEKKGERNKQISQHRSQHECSILYDSVHHSLNTVNTDVALEDLRSKRLGPVRQESLVPLFLKDAFTSSTD